MGHGNGVNVKIRDTSYKFRQS